jgi:hypothetical protein
VPEKPISKSTIFVDGAARFSDLIYVIGKDRKLAEAEVRHARFIGWDRGTFGHNGDRNWNAVAIGVVRKPAEKMVAIGEDGEVFTYVGGTDTDERIKPKPICLRNIGVVDGLAYACGMNRQVYRRSGENSWQAMHAPAPKRNEDTGFEAIDGFSAKEIYAVGWEGEIWDWDGSKWLSRGSPTNLILTGVCCAGDKKVYACGQNGTLLRGRHDAWDVIDLEEFTDDFWDVHWFKRKLYLATMTELFTYTSAGLEPVDFGDDAPGSCYRLTDAEGVLWSVGSDDVFSFDGTGWTRVD